MKKIYDDGMIEEWGEPLWYKVLWVVSLAVIVFIGLLIIIAFS
jgi:hypothetical protein